MRTEEIFSKRLKVAMGKMTQRQLAAKIGTTEVTVSRWLNGSRIPKLTDAVQIASVLNVSLDYLSGISEFPKDRAKKVIPLEKALNFCEKERQRWHAYKLKALECKGYVESLGGAALGDQKEGMFGYEIPNILRLLCEDKECI